MQHRKIQGYIGDSGAPMSRKWGARERSDTGRGHILPAVAIRQFALSCSMEGLLNVARAWRQWSMEAAWKAKRDDRRGA